MIANGYVVINSDTGKYVSRPGSARSYTTRLENARIFDTREQAERDKCGNEYIVPLSYVLGGDR